MLNVQDEKLLLAEISAGNEESFRRLYMHYFNKVSAYVFKITKSDETTAEIVQDVFIKLWQNRALLTQIDNVNAYIYSLSRNKCIDYLRRLAREMHGIKYLTESQKEYDNNTDRLIDLKDLQLIIDQALSTLSGQKKQIFRLSKIEGLSHDEIAEVMNLSKSTVKNHLSETLKHLRHYIKQRPDHEYIVVLCFLELYMH